MLLWQWELTSEPAVVGSVSIDVDLLLPVVRSFALSYVRVSKVPGISQSVHRAVYVGDQHRSPTDYESAQGPAKCLPQMRGYGVQSCRQHLSIFRSMFVVGLKRRQFLVLEQPARACQRYLHVVTDCLHRFSEVQEVDLSIPAIAEYDLQNSVVLGAHCDACYLSTLGWNTLRLGYIGWSGRIYLHGLLVSLLFCNRLAHQDFPAIRDLRAR